MLSESEILKGCRNNNRKKQELLYKKYAPKLLGICFRYCKNREDAEDILQESFIKIFKNIKQFREEVLLIAWMRRIIINTAFRHYSQNNKFSFNVPLNESIGDNIQFKDNIFDKFSKDELLNAVQSLPVGFRTIFNLYAVEGYKHKEIAEMLEISENTSKSQYSRAKKILQKKLKKKIQEPRLSYSYKPIVQ